MKGWKKKNWETIGKFGRRRNDRTSPGSLFAPARSNNSIAIPFIYAVGIAVTVAIFHRASHAALKPRWNREERKNGSVGERGGMDRSVSGWRATSRHRERAKRCVLVNWFLLEGAGGSRKKRRGKRERRAEFAFFRLLSSRELLKRRMEGVGSSHREIKIRTLCPFLASPRPSPPRTGAVARCPSTRLKTIPARCNSIW